MHQQVIYYCYDKNYFIIIEKLSNITKYYWQDNTKKILLPYNGMAIYEDRTIIVLDKKKLIIPSKNITSEYVLSYQNDVLGEL